jgi:protein-S-isoprenylcysteine O-methyltransferase Ste14
MTSTTSSANGGALAADVASASGLKRFAVLVYGVGSYGVGVAALVAWIVAMLGFVDFNGLGIQMGTTTGIAFNVAMMVAFGVQHSVMARPAFKEKMSAVIPPAAERSTFVLATGLILGPMVLLWQPLPTVLFEVQLPAARYALLGLALVGWTYLFLATFAINHFELFGLRQVYQYSRGDEVTPVPFKERWMYRFDRHPIMTDALPDHRRLVRGARAAAAVGPDLRRLHKARALHRADVVLSHQAQGGAAS